MPHIGERVRIDLPGWGSARIVGDAANEIDPVRHARLRASGWGPYWVVLPEESTWANFTPGETMWVLEGDLTPLDD